MTKKCPNCRLINFAAAENCSRCQAVLTETAPHVETSSTAAKVLRRAVICVFVIFFVVAAFYLSLIFSAKSHNFDERQTIRRAIKVLSDKGFDSEVFLLEKLTVFRANDNWLNASIEKENAYAATNFPFEIMTVYPDFFTYTTDDTERAAILLHEAQHLKGADEKKAYEFVWKNRKKLGWTRDIYADSIVWRNVRKQAKEYAPNTFVCDVNDYGDCTE